MRDTLSVTSLRTRQDAIGTCRLDTVPMPLPLQAGEVLLRLDCFALTTNNLTYAAFGERMHYWDLFPTGEAGWGQMPVWGFGEVLMSSAEGVTVGERFYGFFPIASHLKVQATRIKPHGFFDGAEHRQTLAPVYNHYQRCSTDPAYQPGLEHPLLVVRPLFTTSFVCADFLADQAFFGARQVVISSASSKTAYGTAHCLGAHPGIQRIGLTSPRHQDFLRSLGCYDRVVGYDELASQSATTPTLYLDFAGSPDLRERVRQHFGAALVYDCVVGSAQHSAQEPERHWPAPHPAFFFAPTQIQKRRAEWGVEGFEQRLQATQTAFLRTISDPQQPWMRIRHGQGFAAASAVIAELHAGRADPREAHVVSLANA